MANTQSPSDAVKPEDIYRLPEQHRIALVIGLHREDYDKLIAAAASGLLKRFADSGIQQGDLEKAMKKRVEILIGYNSQQAETFTKPGLDYDGDTLASYCGDSRFITGMEMKWGIENPRGTQEKRDLGNYAKLESLVMAARMMHQAGLHERAEPLMHEYGKVSATNVLDEKLEAIRRQS